MRRGLARLQGTAGEDPPMYHRRYSPAEINTYSFESRAVIPPRLLQNLFVLYKVNLFFLIVLTSLLIPLLVVVFATGIC